MWFEKPRSLSLILVITGVEAGERGRPCRSAAVRGCWPGVGRRPSSCVDTWTTRPLCTVTGRRPRPLPVPPAGPSPPPAQPADVAPRGGARCPHRVETRRPGLGARWTVGPAVRRPGGVPAGQRAGRRLSPTCAHGWGQVDPAGRSVAFPLHTVSAEPCGQSSRGRPRRLRERERGRATYAWNGLPAGARAERSEVRGAGRSFDYWRARLLMRAVSSVTWV